MPAEAETDALVQFDAECGCTVCFQATRLLNELNEPISMGMLRLMFVARPPFLRTGTGERDAVSPAAQESEIRFAAHFYLEAIIHDAAWCFIFVEVSAF